MLVSQVPEVTGRNSRVHFTHPLKERIVGGVRLRTVPRGRVRGGPREIDAGDDQGSIIGSLYFAGTALIPSLPLTTGMTQSGVATSAELRSDVYLPRLAQQHVDSPTRSMFGFFPARVTRSHFIIV